MSTTTWDNISITSESASWMDFKRFIDSNKEKEFKPRIETGLCMAGYLSMAAFIEGCLSDVLAELLKKQYGSNDLVDYTLDSIYTSESFSSLKNKYGTLCSINFKQKYDVKKMNGINHLFKLRNHIVHGNPIQTKATPKENGGHDLSYIGNSVAIMEYLVAEKLIERPGMSGKIVLTYQLCSKEIYVHFHELTIWFVGEILNEFGDLNTDLHLKKWRFFNE